MNRYLTCHIPGTGGTIKETPEDFFVEELPAYLPCGSGEHLYLTIEKRGITTLEAIRRIACELKVSERDVGYAGMKDSAGCTRQTISVQKVKPEDALALELDSVSVISAVRHTNKLKLGHLKGNRFRIAIRGVSEDAAESASHVTGILGKRGVPNYFGHQRYGTQGNSHLIGLAMLRRDWKGAVDRLIGVSDSVRDEQWQEAIRQYHNGNLEAALRLLPRHCRSERDVLQRLISKPGEWEKSFSVINPRLRKLYLSAYQSFLFDRVVEQRLEEIDQVYQGDLAWKHINGACFLVEDADVEAPRAASFEISSTGPMFGCKMKMPGGDILMLEQQILSDELISLENFDRSGGLRMEGERRPLRVALEKPVISAVDGALILEFTLPKGSYATSVIREITKTF